MTPAFCLTLLSLMAVACLAVMIRLLVVEDRRGVYPRCGMVSPGRWVCGRAVEYARRIAARG
jgi:hypothetical protein